MEAKGLLHDIAQERADRLKETLSEMDHLTPEQIQSIGDQAEEAFHSNAAVKAKLLALSGTSYKNVSIN